MNRYLPSKLLYQRIILLCSLTLAFNGQANNDIQNLTLKNNCSKQNIHFKRNTIFDEQDKDILFFHRWVNALHITTKQITLKNEAAFFLKKCHKTEHDLAELERHLRGRKFIRDAKVTTDASLNNITVETWDNWSLMPTFSYGRKGGVNTYSVGIKDRNLLGLGIDAQLQSFSNAQRSGYKLDTTVPLFLQKNTELILRIADNNDGKQNALFINKAFAGLDTDYAYSIGFNDEKRSDTLFQNGQTLTNFRHNIAYKTVNYSWLSQSFYNDQTHSDDKLRYSIGITQNRNVFSPSEPAYP